MRKILALLLISVFFITGCSVKKVSDNNIDVILETLLSKKINLYNHVSNGYKYYAPRGLRVIDNTSYNEKLYSDGETYYLYVDVVSYFYKKTDKYVTKKDIYYSKELSYNDKKGYIEIRKKDNLYYIVMVYNYSKVEVISAREDINKTVVNILYILNSIKYNDTIIKGLFDNSVAQYSENKFKLFVPKTDESNFLNYDKQYDQYEKEIDEDLLTPDDNTTEEDTVTQ